MKFHSIPEDDDPEILQIRLKSYHERLAYEAEAERRFPNSHYAQHIYVMNQYNVLSPKEKEDLEYYERARITREMMPWNQPENRMRQPDEEAVSQTISEVPVPPQLHAGELAPEEDERDVVGF